MAGASSPRSPEPRRSVASLGGKALVKVGYACNQRCVFCHTAGRRPLQAGAAEVREKIERAAALGHDMVVLSGGEPTIRPELLDWASHTARSGLALGLVTNGLMLRYPDLVRALLHRGLRYVQQSLHAGTAEVHDGIVRREAFESAWEAVANLAGAGIDHVVNCVVTTRNVDGLEALVERAVAFPSLRVKLSLLQPKGDGLRDFEALAVPPARAAARAREVIGEAQRRIAASGASGPIFSHEGFPLCLLPGLEDRVDDLRAAGFSTMCEVGERDFFPIDEGEDRRPEPTCGSCSLRGSCPGLHPAYRERFGDAGISPVRRSARPNSFTYVFREVVAAGDSGKESCPLRETPIGVTPWDPARQLFVRRDARVGRYEASTRDFADDELFATKNRTGQVYLDVSSKDAPDDFGSDLVALRREDACGGCPHDRRCTGLYEALDADPFRRDEGRLRAVLAALEGDVLDIGCGEAPYADALGAACTEGRARYVCLDPDPGRIEALRRRRPWAKVLLGTAEALEELLEPAWRFDHVLLLRSWNHLRDVATVLRALEERMRPGATVTIVDNVVFGLARSRAQTARAESSKAAFEHFRNHGAEEAARTVGPFGWKLLERHDVGPESSNQWLLRYRRGQPARDTIGSIS